MPESEGRSSLDIGGIRLARRRDLAEETATVASAYDAGVFQGLLEGPAGPSELAERMGLDPRAVGILLPVLAELGLLHDDDGRYGLTEATRRSLADPGSPDFEGGGLPLWIRNLRSFTRMPEVLAEGGPLTAEPDGDDGADDEESLARFMAGMAAAPRERIERAVRLCVERLPRDGREGPSPRMLDVGGGPGHMTRAFVEEGLEAVLFDTPETVDFVATEYGLDDEPRIELVGGDFREDPLPDGPFDLVLVSNVVHIYSPETNRSLLRRVGSVTRPGGVCAVADFIRGSSPRAPRFALVMLLNTEEGDTYTEDQIVGWLEEAGFRSMELADLDEDRQLVTGVREGA